MANMNEAEKQLTWIGRRIPYSRKDVSISCRINEKGEKHYAGITFRNDVSKLFTDTDYFEVAFFKNRMFFKQSDSKSGLLLGANSNVKESTRYAKMQNSIAKNFVSWVGDYELQFDEFWDLYYIERKDEE